MKIVRCWISRFRLIRFACTPLVVPKSEDPSAGTVMAMTSYKDIAARLSLILSLAWPSDDNTMEVVASIKLRLQPTDAKIPFSQP